MLLSVCYLCGMCVYESVGSSVKYNVGGNGRGRMVYTPVKERGGAT